MESNWLAAIVLGIVEGVTEFLPISSTGHLLIAERAISFDNAASGTFAIAIQAGAVLAVLCFYARDLLRQARAVPFERDVRHFWFTIAVAFVPAAVIGLVAHDWMKRVLYASPTLIAIALIGGGLVFLVVERLPRRRRPTIDATDVSVGQAFVVGVAQVTALVPGVSRSGATIVGGLLSGLDRPAATQFSFYLAIPTLGVATLFDLATSLAEFNPATLAALGLGMGIAALVAWLSIGWLLRYVSHHSFVPFAWYRLVVGAAILGLVQAGML